MQRRFKSGFVFIALLAWGFASASFAADGSSGCGPGWYVFKKNSLVSSSLRGTTNGMLFPLFTGGMTLGTSNCAKHSIVQRSHRSLHFASYNRDHLMIEMAQGGGETLSAYAATWGCPWTAQERFNTVMRTNYSQIFTDNLNGTDAAALNDRVAGAIASDSDLVTACHAG